jgi:hypothetical protein
MKAYGFLPYKVTVRLRGEPARSMGTNLPNDLKGDLREIIYSPSHKKIS